MDNDDLRKNEESEKSLLRDMAKKGISKKIKSKTSAPIIGAIIISGIIISLFIFIIIITPIIINNKGNFSRGTYSGSYSYVDTNSEDNYWWPIGSSETDTVNGKLFAIDTPATAVVTSRFGKRNLGSQNFHYGLDIASYDAESLNIIAVANGTVYATVNTCANNGYIGNNCNSGYGNYVIIEHPGSVYTVYAHLYPGSVTVSKGDTVKQGQVIGKMGNSGNSSGTHLHFQMEIGGRALKNSEDPEKYVSIENPRPVTINSGDTGKGQLLSMLQSWEGCGPTEGDYYKVYDDGYGTLTVGHGVTLKWQASRFSARQVDVKTLSKGSILSKSLVDDIELEIVNEKRNSIIKILEKNNIQLEEYQIDALTIRVYNTGSLSDFVENYKAYGNTEALYNNYLSKPVHSNGVFSQGLVNRREAEWNLFRNGVYTIK